MGAFVKVTAYGTTETGYVNLDRVERLKRTLPEDATVIHLAGRDTQFLVKETPEVLLGLDNPTARNLGVEDRVRTRPLEELKNRTAVYSRYYGKTFRHYKNGDRYVLFAVVVGEADAELYAVYSPEGMPELSFVRPVPEFFGDASVNQGGGHFRFVRRYAPVIKETGHGSV